MRFVLRSTVSTGLPAAMLALGLLLASPGLAQEGGKPSPTPGYEDWLKEYVQLTEAMAGVMGLAQDEASAQRIAGPLRQLSAKWFGHQMNTEGVADPENPADRELGQKYAPMIQQQVQALQAQLTRIQQAPQVLAVVQQAMTQGQADAARAAAKARQQASGEGDDGGEPATQPSSASAAVNQMSEQMESLAAILKDVETDADLDDAEASVRSAASKLHEAAAAFEALPQEEQMKLQPVDLQRLQAANAGLAALQAQWADRPALAERVSEMIEEEREPAGE